MLYIKNWVGLHQEQYNSPKSYLGFNRNKVGDYYRRDGKDVLNQKIHLDTGSLMAT